MADSGLRPPFPDVIWATLEAICELGGSGANREIARKALELGNFSEEQRAVLHRGVGPEKEIEYRVAWARTYLKGVGALLNSGRGVWSLTEIGRSLTQSEAAEVPAEYNRRRRAELALGPADEAADEGPSVFDEGDWKSQLLELLLNMSPGAFERLTRRLLREAGFSSVEVTGRSGDGGIDGTGLYSPSFPSLISFPVVFQCKKYQGSFPVVSS